MTNEYKAAIEKNDEAIKKFGAVKLAYRARKIDDQQFLAAKAEYDLAMAEFDVAFEKESRIQKSAKATMTYIEQVAAKHGIDLQSEMRKSEEVERTLAELRSHNCNCSDNGGAAHTLDGNTCGPEFDRINHGPYEHPVSE